MVIRPLLTIALALTLVGCSHAPLATVTRTLSVGETYDGVHGLCKWGRRNLIVWGKPLDTDRSPSGEATACYQPADLPVHTPDGALITRALLTSPSGWGHITVVWTERN